VEQRRAAPLPPVHHGTPLHCVVLTPVCRLARALNTGAHADGKLGISVLLIRARCGAQAQHKVRFSGGLSASTGFMALVLMLLACDEVTVFGMGGGAWLSL
jgi:hypothetical protein